MSSPEIPLPVRHDWTADMWDWPLQSNEGIARVKNDASGFEVNLEVPYFTPNEIEVKLLGDELVIHCAHRARTDQFGSIAREVHRCYRLPHDIDPTSLKSYLNQRGILTISATKKK
ncbi:small heat shock protein [Trichuris trichiura]|uniref:Small heat shock protein n=1 Tax=Trichuris trichiura TaxID=36087 RepID=A0A077Z6N1_TRITR|nr:small heat shock protein [Trichuris trichiura]